jgi:transcriptional regulator with XRE-family HTH domain
MTTHKRPEPTVIATETLAALAHTVRSAREQKGWTVAALAERSGLSKGMLLQIESARTNPSIGTLIRIANAFGVGVWQLFASPEDTIRTATPRDALTLWRSRKGGKAVLLVGSESPQPVELWEWRLAPGDVYSADAHTRHTISVSHVRRGTLTLVVGKRRLDIAAGGSVVARMDQRHQYRNDGRSAIAMSMVVVDPRP